MDTTYAKRSDGKLIKAKKGIDKSLSFFCPGCKHEVYAATEGRKQRPHFRHKSLNGQTGCSDPESYVHWITKELFAEQYQNAKEFYLSIGVQKKCVHDPVCIKDELFQINLKEKYPYIKVEKNHNGFRPDCLLYNVNGDKLYFEAHYTNGISETKRESGVPIIEVKIYNEKNIDDILKKGGFTTQRSSFFNEPKYYTVMVYNQADLLPEKAKLFDCKNKCINDTPPFSQTRKKQKTQYRINNSSKNSKISLPQSNFTYEFIKNSNTIPNRNQKAVEYLSQVTGRRDRYTIENTIPYILGVCVESYNKNYKQYKDEVLTNSAPVILGNEDTFLFIQYNGIFFGVVRYESKWHIFYIDNYKDKDEIMFIESIEDKKNIKKTIKQHFDIF